MADTDNKDPPKPKPELLKLWREVEPHIVHVSAGSGLTTVCAGLAIYALVRKNAAQFFASTALAGFCGKLVASEVSAIRRIVMRQSRNPNPPTLG